MNGMVDDAGRALITLSVRPTYDAEAAPLRAWVDTAFTGELVIPRATIRVLDLPQSAAIMAGLADGTQVVLDTFSCVIDWFGEGRNPTRLEQRKGRIQRIGQTREEIWIANLRYRDSVEDRVHAVLADRLEAIHDLFGQIPDTLEDVWVQIALDNEVDARRLIDRTTATRNPFDTKYSKVEDADWESCSLVLDPVSVSELLRSGW